MSETKSLPRERISPLGILAIAIAGTAILGVALATGFLQLGIPISPGGNVPGEKLILLNYTIGYDQNQQNPTLLTLWLKNDGVAYSPLSTMTIQDQTANAVPTVTLPLNGSIAAGGGIGRTTVDTLGSGFYFIHGHSYALTIQTARGNRFGFPMKYP